METNGNWMFFLRNVVILVIITAFGVVSGAHSEFEGWEEPDGSVSLRGDRPDEGAMLIWEDGVMGGICSDSWSMEEGRVACWSLGYDDVISIPSFPIESDTILFNDVRCQGYESDLSDCELTRWDPELHGPCGELAGVFCEGKQGGFLSPSGLHDSTDPSNPYFVYTLYILFGISFVACIVYKGSNARRVFHRNTVMGGGSLQRRQQPQGEDDDIVVSSIIFEPAPYRLSTSGASDAPPNYFAITDEYLSQEGYGTNDPPVYHTVSRNNEQDAPVPEQNISEQPIERVRELQNIETEVHVQERVDRQNNCEGTEGVGVTDSQDHHSHIFPENQPGSQQQEAVNSSVTATSGNPDTISLWTHYRLPPSAASHVVHGAHRPRMYYFRPASLSSGSSSSPTPPDAINSNVSPPPSYEEATKDRPA